MRHPFEFIPAGNRRTLFFVFLALTLAGFGIFQLLDEPLRTKAAPAGVVSFELAGTTKKAGDILKSWNNAPAQLNAAFGLGFDFLFMPVYGMALGLGVLLAKERRAGWWPGLGAILGWGALLATIFDALENLALFTILRGGATSPYPELAAGCATIKFGLILAGMLYGLVGWLVGRKNG